MSVEKPNPYNSFVSTTLENGDVKIHHKSKEEEAYIKKHFVQKKKDEMDEEDEEDLAKEESYPEEDLGTKSNETYMMENKEKEGSIPELDEKNKPQRQMEKSWTVESLVSEVQETLSKQGISLLVQLFLI